MSLSMTAPALLLEVRAASVRYRAAGGWPLGLGTRVLQAVRDVSLTVQPGQVLGLVGESGSGKSTLGRAMLGLEPLAEGTVRFDGVDPADPDRRRRRAALDHLRRNAAMVFQDPMASLNPRLTVGQTLAEVLWVHHRHSDRAARSEVARLMQRVGLDPGLADRRPAGLSGGQCQRVGIARALAVRPRLIVADEAVAALDVSIQGQIANLLLDLARTEGMALVFIAHDLGLVRRICDRIAVMYLGRIVEEGPAEAVIATPRHPYTAALVAAMPALDPDLPLTAALLPGEPPSPFDPPPGCPFHPRCAQARDTCRAVPPPPTQIESGHSWACITRATTAAAPFPEAPNPRKETCHDLPT